MLKFLEIKKTKFTKGFTLGEMLLVMIIISIFVALSTPVITKRTRTALLPTRDDIWQYTSNNLDIYFLNKVLVNTTSSTAAQLFVKSAGTAANPQIGIHSTDNSVDAFLIYGSTGRFTLGSGVALAGANGGIAIGNNATTATANSIAIGQSASVLEEATIPGIAIGNSASAQYPNSIAIGNGTITTKKNQIVLGNSGSTLQVNGVALSSDIGLKNISGLYKRGIKELRNLKTYLFAFKDDENQVVRAGLIAQDVKKKIPEAVDIADDKGHLAIKNEFVNYALFNAISDVDKSLRLTVKKEFVLKHKIAKQDAKIRHLEKEIEELSKHQG